MMAQKSQNFSLRVRKKQKSKKFPNEIVFNQNGLLDR